MACKDPAKRAAYLKKYNAEHKEEIKKYNQKYMKLKRAGILPYLPQYVKKALKDKENKK